MNFFFFYLPLPVQWKLWKSLWKHSNIVCTTKPPDSRYFTVWASYCFLERSLFQELTKEVKNEDTVAQEQQCEWKWNKRMWYSAKVRTYSVGIDMSRVSYACVPVVVAAKSKQNLKCGLCGVQVGSLFSVGKTGEDHKVSKWGKEINVTRLSCLG